MSSHPAPHHIPQFLRIASFHALQATTFPSQLLPYLRRLFEHPRRILARYRPHSHTSTLFRIQDPTTRISSVIRTPHSLRSLFTYRTYASLLFSFFFFRTSQTSPTSRFPSRISSMLRFPSLIRFLKRKRGRPRRIKR